MGSFKNNLALIQSDVEQELASLRDSDMANLIGLGGWIRALDAATAALDNKFSEDKAKVIFQPDVPEYFHYILDGVEPEMKERRDIGKIMELLTTLQEQMTLAPGAKPTKAGVEALRKTTLKLMKAALAPRGIITLPVPYGASPLDEPWTCVFLRAICIPRIRNCSKWRATTGASPCPTM